MLQTLKLAPFRSDTYPYLGILRKLHPTGANTLLNDIKDSGKGEAIYGNIMIILITLAIFFYGTKILIAWKKYHIGLRIASIVLLVFVIMSIIIPNMLWVKSPYTELASFKVIDANTKKPIQNVNVVINWDIIWGYFPGTVLPKYEESEQVITDENGKFTVRPRLKPLLFMVLPLFGRNGYEISAFLFVENYKCKFVGASRDDTVYMSRIYSYEECLKNREKVKSHLNVYIKDYNKKTQDFVKNYLAKTSEHCSNFRGGN